jgi:hypothetical protein
MFLPVDAAAAAAARELRIGSTVLTVGVGFGAGVFWAKGMAVERVIVVRRMRMDFRFIFFDLLASRSCRV